MPASARQFRLPTVGSRGVRIPRGYLNVVNWWPTLMLEVGGPSTRPHMSRRHPPWRSVVNKVVSMPLRLVRVIFKARDRIRRSGRRLRNHDSLGRLPPRQPNGPAARAVPVARDRGVGHKRAAHLRPLLGLRDRSVRRTAPRRGQACSNVHGTLMRVADAAPQASAPPCSPTGVWSVSAPRRCRSCPWRRPCASRSAGG